MDPSNGDEQTCFSPNQAAGQAMRKKREEAILRSKVDRQDLVHGKARDLARDLDAKMAKVADKRKEQLARRQNESR